jgi:selenocysteine-specific elongation factor
VGRRFVVGTAGHIDHGKTALVLALTGVDTDRWAEEKRRGITIDLGFAPFDLGPDLEASIVDVPGHEGFVRNMVAGATGIDLALLVVAADEGVMPQTEEHLAILELLGVPAGIPVLTKADAVDPEWLELVRGELTARLARSRIRWAPATVTSAVTGQGLDELRAAVRGAAAELGGGAEHDLFRLPIDRVFAVAGAGTVVTGTTWSGSVAVGEAIRLLPLERDARIRSIEVHGVAAERAVPGRRTALALVGVHKDELRRGHVAVTGPGWRGTTVIEAEVELLAGAPRPLVSRARIRMHLGTAEVLGRVVVPAPIGPGTHGVARLVLETPLVARGGDRFVLRGYSPVSTIGGGVVTDPLPVTRRGRATSVSAARTPAERLLGWLGTAGLAGLSADELPVRLGLVPEAVRDVVTGAGKAVLDAGGLLVSRAAAAAAAEELGAALDRHHRDHPIEPGMSLQALRATLTTPGGSVPGPVADLVCDLAVRKRIIEVEGAIAKRAGWTPALEGTVGDQRGALAARLAAARWEVPTVAELERDLPGVPVRALLANLVRGGGVECMDQERYADVAALQSFRAALEAALAELGRATPAQLRDRFGLTRKYLIPLLEWADRRGITRRSGDARTLARLTV